MADIVTPSGQRLHVEDEGLGPPILLVHGWAMAGAILAPLGERLLDGHRVVRYDLRGHGASAPASSATLDDHAADLTALLELLGLDEALVVAWSLGAQVLVRALPLARGRIRAAVLIGATPRFTLGPDWSHGLPARSVEMLAQKFRRDPTRTRARFLADMMAAAERDTLGPERLAELDASMALPEAGAALDGLHQLATVDLRAELGAIELRALLIHGDADPICMPGAARSLAGAIPGARLALLAGAGHAPFLTREEEVARTILDFAGEHP
jgi:pimeloyl-[acyl-carrier protein] methyl ester esterase